MAYTGEIVDRTPVARGQRVINGVSTSCAAEPTINLHFSQDFNLANELDSNVSAVGVTNTRAAKMIDHMMHADQKMVYSPCHYKTYCACNNPEGSANYFAPIAVTKVQYQ